MMEMEYLSFIVILLPPFICSHNSRNMCPGFSTQVFLPAQENYVQCQNRGVKLQYPAMCQTAVNYWQAYHSFLWPITLCFITI